MSQPRVYVHDDFVIISGIGPGTVLRLMLRSPRQCLGPARRRV
ncbi:MAG TPA: hypothetical protein VKZ47_04225 [Acidimicrobiia bacterium]|nr:hypothetical protein [Acidimicrobiia bacterium]